MRTVRELVDARARQRDPQRDAIFVAPHTGRVAHFGELRASCRRSRRAARAHGLAPGATCRWCLPTACRRCACCSARCTAAAACNPVNLLSQPEQMRYVLDHSDCQLVFVAPDWERARARADSPTIARPDRRDRRRSGRRVAAGRSAECRRRCRRRDPAPDALALLMYTSGTTGKPKGVMLTQANLAANAQAISREHRLDRGDRVLAVLPLYHINAFAVTMLAPLAHGGSLVMPPKFSAARLLGAWRRATLHLAQRGADDHLLPARRRSAARASRLSQHALLPLGLGRAAARAPSRVRSEVRHRHHRDDGPDRNRRAGLLESARSRATQGRLGRARRPAARRASSTRVADRIADGAIGEIVIRGPHVMPGYYKNPEATAAAFFPDGWLRTGDLGYRDADGFFFVTGRIKELIIKGGENIAPREIDEALLAHPAVLDAAAVGIPDRHYGQEIMACVIVRERPALHRGGAARLLRRELGRYKTPKVIRFVAELPRGPSGKVQRLKLAELAPEYVLRADACMRRSRCCRLTSVPADRCAGCLSCGSQARCVRTCSPA